MPDKYIPAADAQFDQWIANFASEIDGFATALGLTAAEVTAITNARADWSATYTSQQVALQNARGFTAQKEASRAEADALLRRTVRRIQTSPAMNDQIREVLRIPVPSGERTPVGPPTETPLVALDWGTRGQMKVRYRQDPARRSGNALPAGVAGALVQFHEGGVPATEDKWQFLTNCSASPCIHRVTGTGCRTFAYRVCYVNRKGEMGPWSAPVVATVTL